MLSVLAALAVLFQAEAVTLGPAPSVENPYWLQRPGGADMARYYPEQAIKRGLSGRVLIVCGVAADGSLAACRVDSELPQGEKFGEAALRMAPLFKMRATTASGQSVEGGVVRIPLRFVLTPGVERLEKLVAAMTCYGHVAHLADGTPKAPGAWQATLFWSLEVAAASANSGLRPSDYEDALSIAHREARERKSPAPDGERDACLAKGAKR